MKRKKPLVADTVQEVQEPAPVLSPLLRQAPYNVGRAIEYLSEAVLGEDAERIGNLLAAYAMLSDEIRRLSVTKEE